MEKIDMQPPVTLNLPEPRRSGEPKGKDGSRAEEPTGHDEEPKITGTRRTDESGVKDSTKAEKAQTKDDSAGPSTIDPDKLFDDERRELRELKQREQSVIAHERAHRSVGGRYAGTANYTYESGPDNRRYVSSGEVSIDTSKEGSPEATIKKMRTVRAAALAPTTPSAQDMRIASRASAAEQRARIEAAADALDKPDASEQGGKGLSISLYV